MKNECQENKMNQEKPTPAEPVGDSRQDGKKTVRRAVKRSAPFFTALILVTVIAWLLPLRPTVSETEKRPLKEFPEFSVSALLSGEYFHSIDSWFTDTFTFREFWVSSAREFKSLYGIQRVAISGDIGISDEIPVIPEVTPVPEATPAGEPTAEPTVTPEPTATPEPTPIPWGGVDIQESDYIGQGAVLQIGDAAYSLTGFVKVYADKYIASINKLAGNLDEDINLYCMLIPENTTVMLKAEDREKYGLALEEDVQEYIYGQMDDRVITVSVIDNLVAHNNEYIAFRSDPHWTALGAYYAYEVWCEEAGVEPVPLSEYEEIQWPGFLGSNFAKASNGRVIAKNPDTVYAYYPPGDVHMYLDFDNGAQLGYESDLLIDRTHSGEGGKYLTFIGADDAKATFINNDITDGSACAVIKTSLGNPWVYYLTQHYQYVYVLDARHYFSRSILSFAREFNVQDVIFAHGTGLAQGAGGSDLIAYHCR